MTRDPVEQTTLGDRLSGRYFLVTLAVFVAVGIPAYFYLVGAVEGQFVRNYTDFSISTAVQVFEGHLEHVPGGAFSEPLSGRELDAFLVDVNRQVNGGDLVKMKVWRPDGMLLYSTSGIGVGSTREPEEHFLEAVRTGAVSEIETDHPEVPGEQSSGKVLEIYLPAHGPDGQLSNVFELYYSVEPLTAAVSRMRATLVVFLAVLFFTVAAVAQLGARLLVRRNRQLRGLTDQLARLAETDGLTGVANHRHFFDQLSQEVEASRRDGRRLSLIMADLDFFKRVNDTYGHRIGDVVLREAAAALGRSVRHGDLVARYGGEEFAIMLPDTSEAEAIGVAQRLLAGMRDVAVTSGSDRVRVTASFGIAEFPMAAGDPGSLVAAADSALYVAKKSGRNRVTAFSECALGDVAEPDADGLVRRLQHAGIFAAGALATAASGPESSEFHHHGMSVQLARLAGMALRLSADDRDALTLAASVHNIGKLTAPDALLTKLEPLTADEAAAIRAHADASEKILAAVGDLQRVIKVVRYHHEQFDGGGYPEGLKGNEIPYLARVLHVIDAYAAMTTPHPHRKAMAPEQAIAELRAGAGTHFDPDIVEQLVGAALGPGMPPATGSGFRLAVCKDQKRRHWVDTRSEAVA